MLKSRSQTKIPKFDVCFLTSSVQLPSKTQLRKVTKTYHRIFQNRAQMTSKFRQRIKNNSKVERKDTASTNQQVKQLEQQTREACDKAQVQNLVEQSKSDPFMRSKLKAYVKSQLKTFPTNKNDRNTSIYKQIKNNNKQEQIQKRLFDSINMGGSTKINSKMVYSPTISTQTKGTQTNFGMRIINQFIFQQNQEQPLQIVIQNKLTTFKSESKKGKSQQYNLLRLLSMKQISQFV